MENAGGVTRLVCGRWTKWVVLALWLVLAMVAGPLSGKLGGVQQNDTSQWVPGRAEATQVVELQKKFQTTQTTPAVVVYQRASGVTAADQAAATATAGRLGGVDGVTGRVTGPIRAPDGKALQVVVPIATGGDGWNKISDRVDAIRRITGHGGGGLAVHVAGPAGITADNAAAFSGIDTTLLFATLVVVIAILLLTYRSPILWLLPVMSAGLALSTSEAVIYLLARHAGLTVNGQSAGILTVLVFGASTDYALLLVARYREELRRHSDRHDAMAAALRRVGPAVVASAATVAIAMLCLMFAQMNSTKGLGPVCAVGVSVGLLAMITLLPALLVIFGRWVFWPARPKAAERSATRFWTRLGVRIARRPRTVWIGTVLALGVITLGMTQLKADGMPSQDWFVHKQPDSVVGQRVLGDHFPAGQGQPVVVIGNASAAAPLQHALATATGIARVSRPVTRSGLVYLEGTPRAQPDSPAAEASVRRLRGAVHAISGADAKVGGATALAIDMRQANRHDDMLIIPLVLLVVLAILGLLLRAIVAPLVLIGTVVLSLAATLGLSAVLFQHVFGFNGEDSAFPLFVFVFLVALGIDYNIFLMTRVREEAERREPRRGALAGLTATGGVITSAGFVLAATFATLASLPLVFFIEMGVAVALGVLLDTLVIRSVVVTALNLDLGRWMWWPSRLAAGRGPAGQEPADDARLTPVR